MMTRQITNQKFMAPNFQANFVKLIPIVAIDFHRDIIDQQCNVYGKKDECPFKFLLKIRPALCSLSSQAQKWYQLRFFNSICSEPRSYSELMEEKFSVEGFLVRKLIIINQLLVFTKYCRVKVFQMFEKIRSEICLFNPPITC